MIDRNERSNDDGKKYEQNATAMVYVESVLMTYDLWFKLTTVC